MDCIVCNAVGAVRVNINYGKSRCVSSDILCSYCHGTGSMTEQDLSDLADFLEVSIDDLLIQTSKDA
jgi:hypothetical protein